MADKKGLIIAGGGLAGCLIALAFAKLRPDIPLLLIEQGESFGGQHIWSFFDPDIAPDDRWLVDPLIVQRWTGYDIAFPDRRRTIATGYNSISSQRLDEMVRTALRPNQYRLGAQIGELGPGDARLASGELLPALGVIDARGPSQTPGLKLGWQKFVGRHYRFREPHGLDHPIVMDAMVDQTEGYRFVYCLPFSEDRMLIEDTYYNLSPDLDRAILRARIEAYALQHGWRPRDLIEEEEGVLPVAISGDVDTLWSGGPALPRVGLAGGFFHPTTGYSLPDAVRIAVLLAAQSRLESAALFALLRKEAQRLWAERRFYRQLNRMLFHAAAPGERYRVLEHFYRLDPALIHRFYAGRSTLPDKLRILSGRPPVPIGSAIRAILGSEATHSA